MEEINVYRNIVISHLEKLMSREYEDIQLQPEDVLKDNGVLLHGISVGRKSIDIAPIFYMEAFAVDEGTLPPPVEVAESISGTYESVMKAAPVSGWKELEPEKIRDALYVRPFEQAANAEKLKGCITKDAGNGFVLAVVAIINSDAEGCDSFLLKEGILPEELSSELILEEATKRTINNCKPALYAPDVENGCSEMPDIYDKEAGEIQRMLPMNLTANEYAFGAVTAFLPGVLANISRTIGGDFYFLPESFRDITILKCRDDILQCLMEEHDKLLELMPENEILSRRVFRYIADKDVLVEVEDL